MVYTETTNTSWFGRIKNAFAGIVIGIILFIVGFPVLWINEGYSVKVYKTLKDVRENLVSIGSDKVDPANQGKLIHTMGDTATEDTLSDKQFGISEQAIRLRRSSEMYQYKERVETRTKKKLGGGEETVKEYHYDKTWSSSVINSSKFKDLDYKNKNATSNPFPGATYNARNVDLGAFKLNDSLISDINNFENYDASGAQLSPELAAKLKANGGGYYFGEDPGNPQINDVRITFSIVRPSNASVIAQQVGDSFEKYTSKVTDQQFEMLLVGQHSADAMVTKKETENKIRTWIIRGVGVFLMFFGLVLLFKPLSVLADVIPFIGNVVGGAGAIVAGLMAAMFGSLTIGIAWVAYRPLVGIPLLAVTVGCIVMLIMRKKKSAPAAANQQYSAPPPPQAPPPPPPPPPA